MKLVIISCVLLAHVYLVELYAISLGSARIYSGPDLDIKSGVITSSEKIIFQCLTKKDYVVMSITVNPGKYKFEVRGGLESCLQQLSRIQAKHSESVSVTDYPPESTTMYDESEIDQEDEKTIYNKLTKKEYVKIEKMLVEFETLYYNLGLVVYNGTKSMEKLKETEFDTEVSQMMDELNLMPDQEANEMSNEVHPGVKLGDEVEETEVIDTEEEISQSNTNSIVNRFISEVEKIQPTFEYTMTQLDRIDRWETISDKFAYKHIPWLLKWDSIIQAKYSELVTDPTYLELLQRAIELSKQVKLEKERHDCERIGSYNDTEFDAIEKKYGTDRMLLILCGVDTHLSITLFERNVDFLYKEKLLEMCDEMHDKMKSIFSIYHLAEENFKRWEEKNSGWILEIIQLQNEMVRIREMINPRLMQSMNQLEMWLMALERKETVIQGFMQRRSKTQ